MTKIKGAEIIKSEFARYSKLVKTIGLKIE